MKAMRGETSRLPGRRESLAGLSAILAIVATGTEVQANEPDFAAELYVGVSFPKFDIGKDFNGRSVYVGAKETVLLPTMTQDGLGWGASAGVVMGTRLVGGGVEFGYLRHAYEASFLDWRSTGTLHLVPLDVRGYLFPAAVLSPYVIVGGAFSWMSLEDCVIRSDGTEDATFKVFGKHVGAGIMLNLPFHVFLRAEAVYRWIRFYSASIPGEDWAVLEPSANASGVSYVVSAGYQWGGR